MTQVGLEGKPTATHAGTELVERINGLVKDLGPIPHAALDVNQLTGKKQTTRLMKLVCPEHTDYILRASRKTIEVGLPKCGVPACGQDMEAA